MQNQQTSLRNLPPSEPTKVHWSKEVPGLQTRVNSSAIGEYKTCARKYWYKWVRGLRAREPKIDLEFGTWFHSGVQGYESLRNEGESHEEALAATVDWALFITWDSGVKRPRQIDHSSKNREGLVRTLIWYLDKYGEEDVLETVVLPDGALATELEFEFDSGYCASSGERISFCGKLDRIVNFAGGRYIRDIKTTGGSLGSFFFRNFTPGNQFSLYPIAGQICFGIETKGIICDGVEIKGSFARFERALIPRNKEGLNEWLEDSHIWLAQMDRSACEDSWPMNDMACGAFGGCEFREICSMRPEARESWIQRGWISREAAQENVP